MEEEVLSIEEFGCCLFVQVLASISLHKKKASFRGSLTVVASCALFHSLWDFLCIVCILMLKVLGEVATELRCSSFHEEY